MPLHSEFRKVSYYNHSAWVAIVLIDIKRQQILFQVSSSMRIWLLVVGGKPSELKEPLISESYLTEAYRYVKNKVVSKYNMPLSLHAGVIEHETVSS